MEVEGGSRSVRRVLLLSPLPSLDPANGDVTYSELLLAHPPPNVEYVRYDDALREGSLREQYRRQPGESPLTALHRERYRLRFLGEAMINRARRRGLLFREP